MLFADKEARRRAMRAICNIDVYGGDILNQPLPENDIYHKTGISPAHAPSVKGAELAYGTSLFDSQDSNNKQ